MEKNMENNYSLVSQQSEMIQKIERLGGKYDSNFDLPIDDQLFICELLAAAEQQEGAERTNGHVKWSGNGSYKRSVNFELTESKLKVINELKTFTYLTPPIKISQLLESFFAGYDTNEEHWLYISQNFNPRAINRVINYIVKVYLNKTTSIQNPAAYFTYLIKKRKKRRSI